MTTKKRIPLMSGDATMTRLRTSFEARDVDAAPALEELADLPYNEAAAMFWSSRAWSEYAAVPAMSQTMLALIRTNAPMDAMAVVSRIQTDEVVHTEMSRDVAEAFGGYTDEIPEWIACDPIGLGDANAVPLPFWTVGIGCISETVSLALLQARLRRTHHPVLKRVLRRVLKDEATHVRFGWELAEKIVPKLDETYRRRLAEHAKNAFGSAGKFFGTFGLPADIRREEREIRAVTAELGYGACPADEADHVIVSTIAETIAPRLAALGLPLGDTITIS